jgi:SET domain-containing protein
MPVAPPCFEIRKSSIQGSGAFATRSIPKRTRLLEYVGERISAAEASRRYDDTTMRRHHTFLFDLDGDTCIDAGSGGNDARFFNHSCMPNCEALIVRRRIYIYSLRRISTGDELTYDYQYIVDGPLDATARRLYRCRCGTRACRGSIVAPEPPRRKRAVPM